MASDQRQSTKQTPQQAQERKKRAFVGILAVALCAVLYIQFGGGEIEVSQDLPAEGETAQDSTPSTPVIVSPVVNWVPTLSREYVSISLPSRSIEEIVMRHPMGDKVAVKTEIANEVKSEPLVVTAIYSTPKRSAAIVGTSIVREGDKLPDGRRLVAAGPNGLQTQARPALSADRGQ